MPRDENCNLLAMLRRVFPLTLCYCRLKFQMCTWVLDGGKICKFNDVNLRTCTRHTALLIHTSLNRDVEPLTTTSNLANSWQKYKKEEIWICDRIQYNKIYNPAYKCALCSAFLGQNMESIIIGYLLGFLLWSVFAAKIEFKSTVVNLNGQFSF